VLDDKVPMYPGGICAGDLSKLVTLLRNEVVLTNGQQVKLLSGVIGLNLRLPKA
jgi:hypothetical protein